MNAQALVRQTLVDLAARLPDGWRKLFLRVELYPDGSGGTQSLAIEPADAPATLVLKSALPTDLVRWTAIATAMAEGGEPWTTADVSMTAEGQFNIDYGYAPLADAPPLERQQRWLSTLSARLERRAQPPPRSEQDLSSPPGREFGPVESPDEDSDVE